MSECKLCELYGLVDRWLDESKVAVAFGDSEDTATTLEECAHDLVKVLPPRGHAFHVGMSAYLRGE